MRTWTSIMIQAGVIYATVSFWTVARIFLKEIFALGKTEFGRVDYSMVNCNIRVWEINTNPTITSLEKDRSGARKPVYDLMEQRFFPALETVIEESFSEMLPSTHRVSGLRRPES